jgi:predicted metalloprotease with PDZ domain
MPTLATAFRVSIPVPAHHLVHVEATVSAAAGALPDSLVLFMPVWTPGSYLVREYARHVEGLTAEAPARASKVRKNAWQLRTGGASRVRVRYRVYAGDLSVRTSHVDDHHAFLVSAALFLGIEGCEDAPVRIEFALPSGWRVTTPLPESPAGTEPGARCYDAPSYDALVDSPFELGRAHREDTFEAQGVPHRVAICPGGAAGERDVQRFLGDAKTLVETLAKLVGGRLPYESYHLFLHLRSQGRGGLEHRSSAALIAPPSAFATREAYLDLLSLVAHEIFHAWNIKRIRPAGLVPYRYDQECYTRLLWWFEGATSYYDWRCLALARLCTLDEYLDHLAAEIAYLDQTPGRHVTALEDASYDAWIKLYRPDENSANSSVSYYRKGEVVSALLDLELRARTDGRTTLDAVLAYLWTEYGEPERPVPEDAMQAIFEHVAGVPMGDLFDAWVRGTSEIPYAATLARFGLSLERAPRSDSPPCSLGARFRSDAGRAFVTTVARDSAAARGGIDAGDEVLGIAGLRVEGVNVDAALRGRTPGQTVDVVIARDGHLAVKNVTLDPPRPDRVKLVPMRDASDAARRAFESWLGPHPTWSGGSRAAP